MFYVKRNDSLALLEYSKAKKVLDNKATLYLIPTIISDNSLSSIPLSTINVIHGLDNFIVERARTARRFIKTTNPVKSIQELSFIEFDEKTNKAELQAIAWLESGISVGVISESGMPGIADPGHSIVLMAHKKGFRVKSLVGPSSVSLALSASGLNGQNFTFHGYLPIKDMELNKKLKAIESQIRKNRQTQIFIETPYRNSRMIKTLLKVLSNDTLLCIASDLTGENEFVQTRSIKDWKINTPEIKKIPTIFLLG